MNVMIVAGDTIIGGMIITVVKSRMANGDTAKHTVAPLSFEDIFYE